MVLDVGDMEANACSSSSDPPKRRQRVGLPNPDLEWFLTRAASALGARGTFETVVSVLQRGGLQGSLLVSGELCTDEQLGWGRYRGRGLVERFRRIERFWRRVPQSTQNILVAFYVPVRLPPGIREELREYAGPAHLLCEGEALQRACRALSERPEAIRRQPAGLHARSVVAQARRAAKGAVRTAHDAWEEVCRVQAEAWVDA